MILIGDQSLITSQLSQLGTSTSSRLTILHSEKVISNSEKPSLALRNSQNSSMRMAIDLVSDQEADACVSGGNTGALMALSRFILKLLPGIERPGFSFSFTHYQWQTYLDVRSWCECVL